MGEIILEYLKKDEVQAQIVMILSKAISERGISVNQAIDILDSIHISLVNGAEAAYRQQDIFKQ